MGSFLRVFGCISFLVMVLIVGVILFSHETPEVASNQSNLEDPQAAAPLPSPKESKDALAAAMESGRINFQQSFATLNKTMPNLRWSDDQIDASDSQESATLVTPYGPCIDMAGNNSAGYGLLFVGNYYHDPHGKGTFLDGMYQDRLTAIHVAEDYCHKWYIAERNNPPNLARDSHMWFAPEEDTASSIAQVPAAPVSTSAPGDASQTLDSNPTPAPIVRQAPRQD